MRTKKTGEERVAPVQLVWSSEEKRLVEPEKSHRHGAVARPLGRIVLEAVKTLRPRAARNKLLRGSTQLLTAEAEEALRGRNVEPANKAITLPVEHEADDRSSMAQDESWQIRGTASDGGIIITRGPGLLSHDLVTEGAVNNRRAWQRVRGGGKWQSPYSGRYDNRKNVPVEDPGSTLYVVDPRDMGAAVEAHDKTWAPNPDPLMAEFDRGQSAAMLRDWQGQAALDEVGHHINSLGYGELPHGGGSHDQR